MYQALMTWATRRFGAWADKILHAAAGAIVCAVVFMAAHSLPIAIAFSAVVGVAKELHDHARRAAGFHADPLDALATLAGAVAVALLIDLQGLPGPVLAP